MAGFVLVQITAQSGGSTQTFTGSPPAGKKWLIKQFLVWVLRTGGGGGGRADIDADIDGADLLLGSGIDITIAGSQRLFIDLASKNNVDGALIVNDTIVGGLGIGGYDNLVVEDGQTLTVNAGGIGGGGTYTAGIFISGHEITP